MDDPDHEETGGETQEGRHTRGTIHPTSYSHFVPFLTLTGASSIGCSIIESVSFQWSATYPPLQWVERGYVR